MLKFSYIWNDGKIKIELQKYMYRKLPDKNHLAPEFNLMKETET